MRHRMGLALVEGIARLSRIDHVAVGLADFGKADGFLERQTGRWMAQLASYSEHAGWPGPGDLGDVGAVRDWLDRYRPTSFRPGIIHGDYHLSNVMYCPHSGELAAIVDWELSTIGAPLIDLGWLLATWPRADGAQEPGIVGTAPWSGFPRPEELVRHYGVVTGHEPKAVEWYAVLACFKLALIQEGTYARACAGKAPVETGAYLHASSMALMRRAREWMRGG
jgi:aminoglycoside phosphotransferase (APT) family kinase protein